MSAGVEPEAAANGPDDAVRAARSRVQAAPFSVAADLFRAELARLVERFDAKSLPDETIERELAHERCTSYLPLPDHDSAIRAALRRRRGGRTAKPERPASAATESAEAPRSSVTPLADVVAVPVDWLWPYYIPRGALTILDGDPGLGKSTIIADIAARLSRGQSMPDGSAGGAPANTLLISSEDDAARTIRPRCEAAGADLSRIFTFAMATGAAAQLPGDLHELVARVEECRAEFVVLDPLVAYFGPAINAWKDQDVRQALGPLANAPQLRNVAIVAVRHLNKGQGSAIQRGGGSIGIVAAARSALIVGKDPDDPARRVLASVKSNWGPEPPSLGYRLVCEGNDAPGKIEWLGAVSTSANALVAPFAGDGGSRVRAAESFLLDLLANGAVPSNEVFAAAKAKGIAAQTVRRAKAALSVVAEKGGMEDGWTWRLPEDAHDGPKMPVSPD